jgi:hypothetical protein
MNGEQSDIGVPIQAESAAVLLVSNKQADRSEQSRGRLIFFISTRGFLLYLAH